eukprot:CAMPEP_0198131384 /NCGR_PEP_ID=MMETSP1442-20131203/56070_1 /TAXON_ID= /ORGANISM="Craspedostauros australis, Strain CCMP3328" /LENGTH=111 /DNA_ID=CAMNT_0043792183 /DNA_START=327 /DNA_END=662 /DNA_ORIENTATION=-
MPTCHVNDENALRPSPVVLSHCRFELPVECWQQGEECWIALAGFVDACCDDVTAVAMQFVALALQDPQEDAKEDHEDDLGVGFMRSLLQAVPVMRVRLLLDVLGGGHGGLV